MLETVSQEKKVAEKQTVLQDEKIKYLEAELVECKEKVKYFKPKNIRQREETKKKQLAIIREKNITMEKQICEKQREINQLWETINQNLEDNEKQNIAAFDEIFNKDNQLAALGEELKKRKTFKEECSKVCIKMEISIQMQK